jgi:hypothetical protein
MEEILKNKLFEFVANIECNPHVENICNLNKVLLKSKFSSEFVWLIFDRQISFLTFKKQVSELIFLEIIRIIKSIIASGDLDLMNFCIKLRSIVGLDIYFQLWKFAKNNE